ncbi:MAG: dihydrolipoyllysine-residue acetyltransferase, partial [Acidobacteria bacterium]
MTEFKLPELGENVHQGDLVRLMVAPGATVAEGQPVMELETDKAVVEVPSSISGTVKDVLVKQGEKLKVGQVIFTIENGNRPTTRSSSERAEPAASQPKSAPAQKAPAAPGQKASVAATQPSAPAPARARAIPAVPAETAEVAEFKLPELGENVHQGDLVRLMVSPGTRITAGQPVMELETDKAVVEVPSSVTGTVNDVLVKQGEKIKVGQVIFT